MQNLIKQERFELEVLDKFKTAKLLDKIIFTGGSMLRLCYGLNRYSVDLDFWILKNVDQNKLYEELSICLSKYYTLKDAANKFYTLLFELKSKDYPRSLKVEIRKERKEVQIERSIAYSIYSNNQVFINSVSLPDMMKAKICAFLDRKEIRDVFDIEFLLRKGVALDASQKELDDILKNINSLTKNDYNVKLASLLEKEEREYYKNEGFKFVKSKLIEKLAKE